MKAGAGRHKVRRESRREEAYQGNNFHEAPKGEQDAENHLEEIEGACTMWRLTKLCNEALR